MGEVVNCAAYADGRRGRRRRNHQTIDTVLKQEECFLWVGLHEPGEPLLRQVQQAFGLHDLAIEDAHRSHQRPKLERYGNALFVVLRTAPRLEEPGDLRGGETPIFVGPPLRHLGAPGSSLAYTTVRTRCEEATPALLRHGPGFVLYALMDFIVDQYFPVLDVLEEARCRPGRGDLGGAGDPGHHGAHLSPEAAPPRSEARDLPAD